MGPSAPQAFPLPYPLRVGFHLTRPSHSRQIHSSCTPFSTDRLERSIFGLVEFYNALPGWVVEISETRIFQRVLQKAVQRISVQHRDNWQAWMRGGWKSMFCQQLDATFHKA